LFKDTLAEITFSRIYASTFDTYRLNDSNYISLDITSSPKTSDTMKTWDIWIGK
jgi:hypothetical protein